MPQNMKQAMVFTCMMALGMVPLMTVLIAMLFQHNFDFYIILSNMGKNYLFAWPLQLLCVGPLVRWSFGRVVSAPFLQRCLT